LTSWEHLPCAAAGATAGALNDKRKDEEVVVTREEKRW
jgi:hypothetical protein